MRRIKGRKGFPSKCKKIGPVDRSPCETRLDLRPVLWHGRGEGIFLQRAKCVCRGGESNFQPGASHHQVATNRVMSSSAM